MANHPSLPDPLGRFRPRTLPTCTNNSPAGRHSGRVRNTLDAAYGLHQHGPVHQSPTPPIDPSELRPGKRGYWIAGIIAVIGIIIGVGGGVGLFVYGFSMIEPDTKSMLSGTGSATGNVRLTADQEWAVYSTASTSWDVRCTATSGSNTASVTDPDSAENFTSGGQTWYLVAQVKAPADGTYAFTCGPSPDAVDNDVNSAHYFIGEASSFGTIFGSVFGGFAVLFGVPLIAIVVAVIIAAVTGVKRGNHRKRLMAERYGPPPGPPGYGPPPPYGQRPPAG